jgi:menaquinone-dependent protoporphyrinogen IX oxidase
MNRKQKEVDNAKQKYLEDKATQYGIKPVALGFFGGCYDFNKMSWFFKRTLSSIKPKLETAGYKETKTGLYDLRDIEAIRGWAKELSKK